MTAETLPGEPKCCNDVVCKILNPRGNCITVGFCPLFLSKLTPSIRQAQCKTFHAFDKSVRTWIFARGGISLTLGFLPWFRPCIHVPCIHQRAGFALCSSRYYDGLVSVLLILQTAVTDFCFLCSCHLILFVTALTSSDRRHKELNSLKGGELAISAGRRK